MAISTETAPPVTAGERRGHLWVWVSLAAVVLLILGFAGITRVLSGYEPLSNGSVFGVSGARYRTVATYSDQDNAFFRYRDGRMATIKFALRNSGRWDVRVQGLLQATELDAETMQTPMQPIRVLVGPLTTEINTVTPPIERFQPFRPFALAPGDERHVAIQFRFEDCAGLGQGTVWTNDSYTVRYSTLWISRETEVPFPYRLVVKGPIEDCPRL